MKSSSSRQLLKALLKPRYDPFIHGQFVPTASTFALSNPATENLLTHVGSCSSSQVSDAVESGLHAFHGGSWSRADPVHRYKVLNRIASAVESNMHHLVELEVAQTGRPIRELSLQLARIPEWIEFFAALARTPHGYTTPFSGSILNYVERVPLGVVGQITPWNHPLFIAIKKIAPALAAGNSIVVKPSELAPLCILEFARMCHEHGLPEGVLNVVTGTGHDVGSSLAHDARLAKLDFTGGNIAGKIISKAAGENLISCTAELGGKTPVIVFDDADLDAAVSGSAFAAFIASGQTCVMGSRVLVQESIYEKFISKLVQKVESIQLGDPFDPQTQMGPVITRESLDRIQGFVDSALKEGARLATGGHRPNQDSNILSKGYYYRPTVLRDCTRSMKVFQEEVFGPVLGITPFKDEAEAIELANDSIFGLAASIWTLDVKRAHRMPKKMDAGIIWVNGHHHNDPSSPWGGMKASGIGRENGREALESYQQSKSVVVNYGPSSDWFNSNNASSRYG